MRRFCRSGLALGIGYCTKFEIVKCGGWSLELGIIKRVFRRAKTVPFLFCSGAGGCYHDVGPVLLSGSESFETR